MNDGLRQQLGDLNGILKDADEHLQQNTYPPGPEMASAANILHGMKTAALRLMELLILFSQSE